MKPSTDYSPAQLSVIVASYNASATITACLESLERQTVSGFEVIVVDSSTDATAALVATRFPAFRLEASSRRLYPGDARNHGIRQARGELIAFVDADCIANPDWVEQILAAHSRPDLIVGGSVGTANPENVTGWSSYFTEFTPWLPAGSMRNVPDIPTCCLSFKREAYGRFGPFLEGSYCSDTLFNMKATAAGHPPLFVPSIHVRHRNPERLLPLMAKFRMHGRAYAQVRAGEGALARWEALARAVTAPLLVPYLYGKAAARTASAAGYRRHFLRATPLLWITLACWAAGEASGYWSHAAER